MTVGGKFPHPIPSPVQVVMCPFFATPGIQWQNESCTKRSAPALLGKATASHSKPLQSHREPLLKKKEALSPDRHWPGPGHFECSTPTPARFLDGGLCRILCSSRALIVFHRLPVFFFFGALVSQFTRFGWLRSSYFC